MFVASFIGLALLSPTSALLDDDLSTLPADPPPAGRLRADLEARAKVAFDARRKAIAGLTTPEAVLKRQAEQKAELRRMLGEFPSEKKPLEAQVVGREVRRGYAVERVIYRSRPDHHVTANLYLPDVPPPYPGVLVPCGHVAEGKAGDTYQRMCMLLARNGIAALCYDPIGQGERVQALRPSGRPLASGSTTEHTLAGIGALLVGRSAAGYRYWDGVRSLDYLASRPEIDAGRLGCAGNSGGGTETAYLMALDDRIVAANPSCYITSLERLFATIGPQDAEQNLTGQVARGIEHADFLAMRAPRPTLISAGTRDFFDMAGTRTAFGEARSVFQTLGHADRVSLFETDEPHGWTRARREACLNWMRRWLLDKGPAPPETGPEEAVATEAELRCTRTGQVLTTFRASSVFDLTAGRAAELGAERAARFAKGGYGGLADAVRKRLGLDPKPPAVNVHRSPRVDRPGYTIDRWALETEPGVLVPVLLFRPLAHQADRPLIVYVGADRSLAAPGGPIEARVLSGSAVALVEPRGMGEATPDGKASVFGPDHRESFLALHLDRPLFASRVFDVLQALRALDRNDGHAPHFIGIGAGGPIALHAAFLTGRDAQVTLEASVPDWSLVASAAWKKGDLAAVVPGVLADYDLPDLIAAFAPRPLAVLDPIDPDGKPIDAARIERMLAPCRAAYRAAGAAGSLAIEAAQP